MIPWGSLLPESGILYRQKNLYWPRSLVFSIYAAKHTYLLLVKLRSTSWTLELHPSRFWDSLGTWCTLKDSKETTSRNLMKLFFLLWGFGFIRILSSSFTLLAPVPIAVVSSIHHCCVLHILWFFCHSSLLEWSWYNFNIRNRKVGGA